MRRIPRGVAFWAALAVAVVIVAAIAAPRRNDGPPLDPTSTGPLGTRGLVLVLRQLGGDVRISDRLPTGRGTALVLVDDLRPSQRTRLRSWVAAGGVLVVADPLSDLSSAVAQRRAAALFDVTDERDLTRQCDLPALRGVRRIDPAGGVLFRPPTGDPVACFRRSGAAFLVAEAQGAGAVVALGGPGWLVNDTLDHADNAALAGALLVPSPGTPVTLLRPSPAGGGRRSLIALISPRVKAGLWQLGIAFGVVVLWRARRFGRPVPDRQPVEVPGSELVVARGALLQLAGQRDEAARLVRDDLRRSLADRMGLPPTTPPEVVARVTADRTGVSIERATAVLVDRPLPRDEDLVKLAQDAERIQQEVARV